MINFETLFLQASGGGTYNLIFFGLIILVFWMFLIRPQSKKQKEQRKFGDDLQKGDDVVTASGMLGRISKIEEDIVTLEVGTKTFIRVTKNAISKEMTDALYSSKDKK